MNNQLRNLFSSTISEISILIFICTMLRGALSESVFASGGSLSIAFALAGGVVAVAWLAWATYVLATKKTLTPMPPGPMIAVETCSRIFILCWACIATSSYVIAVPFGIWFIWQEYRLIRDLRERERGERV